MASMTPSGGSAVTLNRAGLANRLMMIAVHTNLAFAVYLFEPRAGLQKNGMTMRS